MVFVISGGVDCREKSFVHDQEDFSFVSLPRNDIAFIYSPNNFIKADSDSNGSFKAKNTHPNATK
jgi:hypothetical protein